jgi:hypothetical protein
MRQDREALEVSVMARRMAEPQDGEAVGWAYVAR